MSVFSSAPGDRLPGTPSPRLRILTSRTEKLTLAKAQRTQRHGYKSNRQGLGGCGDNRVAMTKDGTTRTVNGLPEADHLGDLGGLAREHPESNNQFHETSAEPRS